MGPAWQSLWKSPEHRRRLTLALATAEERLIEAHARAAADFLRVTSDELPYERALDIFGRLTDLPDRMREAVAVQALAALAEEPAAAAPGWPSFEGVRGAVRRFVERLKGRRASALRVRVARASRRADEAIEAAYLDGAALVAQELGGATSRPEAVQLFIDSLDIGPRWGERIFHLALASDPTASTMMVNDARARPHDELEAGGPDGRVA